MKTIYECSQSKGVKNHEDTLRLILNNLQSYYN